MGFTQADLERLERAIAQGAKRVRYDDGREVEYHSLSDLLKAKGIVEAALGDGKPRRKVLAHSKGLNIGGHGTTEWERR